MKLYGIKWSSLNVTPISNKYVVGYTVTTYQNKTLRDEAYDKAKKDKKIFEKFRKIDFISIKQEKGE